MITEAMARALDSAGDGVGRVFAHFRVGRTLKLMCERIDKLEKELKAVKKQAKTADNDDTEASE